MTIVGIDLGTTNSLAAHYLDGNPDVIQNALGDALTPSVVTVDESGEILVGRPAAERLSTHPQKTAAHFKRAMGTDRVFILGEHDFRAEELSAMVLRALKEDAEAHLGEDISEAVISVPAYFNDTQRNATKAAGELAGLKVERLINEPTAAAIAYGLNQRDAESKFLVFDLGGGTFDVSILELFEGIMEVHASAGDTFLGGKDFAEILIDRFAAETGLKLNRLSELERGRIWNLVEAAKLELSRNDLAEIVFSHKSNEFRWTVKREEFGRLAEPLLERMRTPVERAFRDAEVRAAELDAILLVGGATRMPMVRAIVARLFGQIPSGHIDPDKVVALGAAVQAALKSRDKALEDRVLTDVCPYTLGVETVVDLDGKRLLQGRFAPIIDRNTVVPVSRVETFSTMHKNQRQVQLEVYQGESRMVQNNIKLGTMLIDVPRGKAGEQLFDVRFTYDINGILEVEVTVNSTKEKKRLIIEGNAGVLSKDEINRRFNALEKLKLHPRDTLENRTILARAERIYEESLSDLRNHVAVMIDEFEAVLQGQNPKKIAHARKNLSQLLDEVEAGWSEL